MARVFYSMAGEGRGHATRARAVVEMLRSEHEITLFAPEMAYALLSEAYADTDVRVRRLAGLRFHYRKNRLSYPKTVWESLGYVRRMPWVLRSLQQRIASEKPDLCITDFEPLLPRAARAEKVPFISFDHQHFLAVSDFADLPPSLRWRAEALGHFTRWFYRGQRATIVSSFYSPPIKRGLKNVAQVGVMLRPEVLAAQSADEDHVLVYLRRFPHAGLIDALRRTGREVIVYGVGQQESQAGVHFREIDERGFLADLASCHALVCNAGNQLVGEALYLRKPVLAIPEAGNLEQLINAHYVRRTGGGDWLDADRVSGSAVKQFFAKTDQLRSQINPEHVRGNEAAVEIIQQQLPVLPSSPAAVPSVKRTKKAKRTGLLWRAGAFARTVLRQRLRRDDLPRFLTFTVTFSCNARCIMCDSWKMPSPDDLTLDEISRVFDELPAMDAVRLTGGEPFVRADFPEIVRLSDEKLRPLFLHITTNGFLTKRIVKFCEERDKKTPLQLLVSVDGVEHKHNEVRGHSGAWRSVMETLKTLAPRQKELNLKLSVNQTIVDAEGVEHYKMLREILKPLGVHNNVVMAYDTSATYNLDRDVDIAPTEIGQFSTFGEFNEAHLNELISEIDKDLQSFPLVDRLAKRYYLRGIANRLLGHGGKPNPPCVALTSHMRLFPNGDVPSCQFNSKTIGNLRHQSFRDVWKSATAQKQRDWVRACPGCWAECEVLPSAIYTLDLLKESINPAPTPTTTVSAKPAAVSSSS